MKLMVMMMMVIVFCDHFISTFTIPSHSTNMCNQRMVAALQFYSHPRSAPIPLIRSSIIMFGNRSSNTNLSMYLHMWLGWPQLTCSQAMHCLPLSPSPCLCPSVYLVLPPQTHANGLQKFLPPLRPLCVIAAAWSFSCAVDISNKT